MNTYKFIVSIIISSIVSANLLTVDEILHKSLHRYDGVNHSFKLTSNKIGGKNKIKNYQVFVNWPDTGNISSQIKISRINPKRKKPAIYWIQNFKDGAPPRTFMSMPITGKLKDVSGKKFNSKEFSFRELWLSEEEIKSYKNALLENEKLDGLLAYVVESKKNDNNGNTKRSKKFWIEKNSYMILKVELYTGSGRLYKTIHCSQLNYIDKIGFPEIIGITDLKTKNEIQVSISEIIINPFFDSDTFIPRDQ